MIQYSRSVVDRQQTQTKKSSNMIPIPFFRKKLEPEMKVIPLQQQDSRHTHVVLSFVVQSLLDYGDIDNDVRLLSWNNNEGQWAVAIDDQGHAMGIVCVVRLSDRQQQALLWLEVLPQYQEQGIGSKLLAWAQTQAGTSMIVKSVPSANGFYQHAGVCITA
jgi:GNAT superfamily N-acetyltransferase